MQMHVNQVPDCVRQKVKELREKGGAAICHEDNYSYVILALGRRPTGGYSIQIDEVKIFSDKLMLYARELKPGPDDFVTQAITYPVKVKKLPYTPLPLVVVWK